VARAVACLAGWPGPADPGTSSVSRAAAERCEFRLAVASGYVLTDASHSVIELRRRPSAHSRLRGLWLNADQDRGRPYLGVRRAM